MEWYNLVSTVSLKCSGCNKHLLHQLHCDLIFLLLCLRTLFQSVFSMDHCGLHYCWNSHTSISNSWKANCITPNILKILQNTWLAVKCVLHYLKFLLMSSFTDITKVCVSSVAAMILDVCTVFFVSSQIRFLLIQRETLEHVFWIPWFYFSICVFVWIYGRGLQYHGCVGIVFVRLLCMCVHVCVCQRRGEEEEWRGLVCPCVWY